MYYVLYALGALAFPYTYIYWRLNFSIWFYLHPDETDVIQVIFVMTKKHSMRNNENLFSTFSTSRKKTPHTQEKPMYVHYSQTRAGN